MENQIEKKKLLVIGCGIAGLTAGIYAARAGFDVQIFEQHNIPGGFQTGWSRQGFFFEGGMHWLTGSSEKTPLSRIWKEVGALQQNNPVEIRDPFYTLIDNSKKICMYRDVKKLKKEFLSYAPEDKKMIKRLCKDISYFKSVHMPVLDIFGVKCKNPTKFNLFEFIAMAPAGLRYFYLKNISYKNYVAKFKNKNLRHLLMSVIGDRYNALSFIYTMGALASGDGGYPLGGSVQLVENMKKTFEELGGKIFFKSFVEKIQIENYKAIGIQTSNGFISGDAIIVTTDMRQAIDNFFEKPILEKWTKNFRRDLDGSQNIFIGMGLKGDFSHLPTSIVFPLEKPFEYGGCSFNELRINNYSKYTDHAPSGKTTFTCILLAACYDFWKKAKENGSYKEKKKEFANLFIEKLENFIPEIKDKIEVIDVATPVTYERYCKSFKGSWMTVWKPKSKKPHLPQKLKHIKNVYFAGQRLLMCGGLPMAAFTARKVIQLLCRDTNTLFI